MLLLRVESDLGNIYLFLRQKNFNKSNKSNYPKQLFAEVLVNRKHYLDNKDGEKCSYRKTYGILLAYDSKKTDGIYDFLLNQITKRDWIVFGKKV